MQNNSAISKFHVTWKISIGNFLRCDFVENSEICKKVVRILVLWSIDKMHFKWKFCHNILQVLSFSVLLLYKEVCHDLQEPRRKVSLRKYF